jgi:hypothetical protein
MVARCDRNSLSVRSDLDRQPVHAPLDELTLALDSAGRFVASMTCSPRQLFQELHEGIGGWLKVPRT